jgi:myo-inositol-1(or 4)-monophosphatase
MSSSDRDQQRLKQILRDAGAELQKYQGSSGLDIQHKADDSLVTSADLASENVILTNIRRFFPDDLILSEESGWTGDAFADGRHVWIIDPLDGTTNFANGYPFYCVSIARAIIQSGMMNVELGGVYDPVRERLYLAARGQGATCNGEKLAVRPDRPPEEAFLVTGFAYHRDEELSQDVERFLKVAERSQSIRRDGAAALDLAMVAEGIYDGYWETGINAWDVAAGSLLVEEAGGIVSNLGSEGRVFNLQQSSIVCGSPGMTHYLHSCLS